MRLTALLFVLVIVPAARAHALGADVKLRGDRVEVEAYYSDNTPARDAHVILHDEAAHTIAEGRTDDHGRWQFSAPPPGQYTVVIDAGAGHRKTVPVSIPDLPPADATVSTGPTRDEFTRFPWERLIFGLAVIAISAIGWRTLQRRRRPA